MKAGTETAEPIMAHMTQSDLLKAKAAKMQEPNQQRKNWRTNRRIE
jgi:hypothetical protein